MNPWKYKINTTLLVLHAPMFLGIDDEVSPYEYMEFARQIKVIFYNDYAIFQVQIGYSM